MYIYIYVFAEFGGVSVLLFYGLSKTTTLTSSSHGAFFHLAYRTKAQIKDVTSA